MTVSVHDDDARCVVACTLYSVARLRTGIDAARFIPETLIPNRPPVITGLGGDVGLGTSDTTTSTSSGMYVTATDPMVVGTPCARSAGKTNVLETKIPELEEHGGVAGGADVAPPPPQPASSTTMSSAMKHLTPRCSATAVLRPTSAPNVPCCCREDTAFASWTRSSINR